MGDNSFGSLTDINKIEKKLKSILILSEKMLEEDPENVIYQSLVVTNSNSLASLFFHSGQSKEARKHLKRSIELCNKKIEKDPENIPFKLDFAKAVATLGNLENSILIDTTSKGSESVQKGTQNATGISSYNIDETSMKKDIEPNKQESDTANLSELLEGILEKKKRFNPKMFYNKWKLSIRFDNSYNVKGNLMIKAGNKTLLNRPLSKEEIEKSLIEIDFLKLGYVPQGEDKISFTTMEQEETVFETINYFEKITNGHEIQILQHDCSNQICIEKEPKIAAVQLKYHAYKENSVIKISTDDNYHKKIIAILEALKNEADIIVFPEFSIPFDYLGEIQKFADENQILVVAGSHYVVDENLEKYGKLFTREFEEADLLKNISPVVIPSSKIVHNEKYLGARIERTVFSEEGMEPGKVNHIFRLQEKLNIGVMICYEFIDTELRHRLIPVCNIILVPQTNDKPCSFYETASTDINRPLEGGNTAFVMANGIFTVGAEENVLGGSTGIALTLDKHSNSQKEKGIISSVDEAMEQLILLATINTEYFPAWDSQIGQVPITTKIIHIFEESEILKDSEGNGKEFSQFLKEIDSCKNSSELKELLEKNRRDLKQKEDEGKDKKKSLIEQYSPLMNKQIQDLKNHNLEKLKKKCSFILIPAI